MNKGIVIKSTGSWYSVKNTAGKIIECRIKGKFRMKGFKTTSPVSVGDNVEYEIDIENQGIISKIHERKNYIIRKSTNLSKQYHIIASNIDNAFLVITLFNPTTSTAFIDRFLVTAEAHGIETTLIFNKLDLYDENQLEILDEIIDIYSKVGYSCLKVSATENVNIDKLEKLTANKTNLFAGHSGTGKSSLVNSIAPELGLRIGDISESHFKGKHTTTFAEMFQMPNKGYIIDTPGIKGFGIINDIKKEELHHYYPEIFKESKNCQYNNCTHNHEPKCAVKEAVAEGIISETRYINYLTILFDEDSKHRV